MRVLALCKRRSSSKDLIDDRFGRYFHLPVQLSRFGVTSVVVAADYRSQPATEVSVLSAHFVSAPLTPRSINAYYRRVKGLAADAQPDLVLAGGDIHFGWVGRRLARRLDVPFVFDVFDNYDTFESARLPGMKRVFRSVASSADLLVVVSRGLADLLDNDTVALIPNGVDMDLFQPLERPLESSPPTGASVGYVGGVASNRGLETLISAIGMLRDRGIAVNLSIAGPLEGGFALPRLPWVDYLGVVDQKEVPSIISRMDVAVLPYPDTDWAGYTSPYKVLEYLACGVPTVVTNVSGFPSLVSAPEAVSQPGDPADMARAIEHQLTHRQVVPRSEAWSWRSRAEDLYRAIKPLI